VHMWGLKMHVGSEVVYAKCRSCFGGDVVCGCHRWYTQGVGAS
jgi:hypothetical protein